MARAVRGFAGFLRRTARLRRPRPARGAGPPRLSSVVPEGITVP